MFIIVKATQGEGGVSSGWPQNRDAAGAKYLGAYHYGEADDDPIVAADHFLATAQPQSGQVIIYDLEQKVDPDKLLASLDRMKAQTRATPLVYSNWKWIKGTTADPSLGIRNRCTVEQWERLVAYPCWLAENAKPGENSTINPKAGSTKGWPVVMHQYTADALDRDYTPDLRAVRRLAIPS